MCDECGEYEDELVAPARMNWADVAYAALAPVEGLFSGLARGAQTMAGVLASHSNHLHDRQDFAKDAGREIESLTSGDGE